MTFSQILATGGFTALALAALVQIVWFLGKRAKEEPLSAWFLGAGAALLLAELVVRSFQVSFVALTSTYESLLFYAAAVAILALAYRLQRRLPFFQGIVFGATMAALVLLAIASSPLLPKDALPPIPALRSGWLDRKSVV